MEKLSMSLRTTSSQQPLVIHAYNKVRKESQQQQQVPNSIVLSTSFSSNSSRIGRTITNNRSSNMVMGRRWHSSTSKELSQLSPSLQELPPHQQHQHGISSLQQPKIALSTVVKTKGTGAASSNTTMPALPNQLPFLYHHYTPSPGVTTSTSNKNEYSNNIRNSTNSNSVRLPPPPPPSIPSQNVSYYPEPYSDCQRRHHNYTDPNQQEHYHSSSMTQHPSDLYVPPYHHLGTARYYSGHHYYSYLPQWHHHHPYPPKSMHDAIPSTVVSTSNHHLHHNMEPLPPPLPDVPVVYVTELGEHDVLSGRGGATNSYRGNRAFRQLVKEYQDQYLRAKKRDKPAVAAVIVSTIRQRGGRFLRRDTNQFRRQSPNNGFENSNNGGGSSILWVDIGDERAREKTCQALREGAPELRRQGHRGSGSGGDGTDHYRNDQRWTTLSQQQEDNDSDNDGISLSFFDDVVVDGSSQRRSPRKIGQPHDNKKIRMTQRYNHYKHQPRKDHYYNPDHYTFDDDTILDDHTPEVRNGGYNTNNRQPQPQQQQRHPVQEITFSDDDDEQQEHQHQHHHRILFIQPWSKLLPDRTPISPISIDQLSVHDRDMYLRDFIPPMS